MNLLLLLPLFLMITLQSSSTTALSLPHLLINPAQNSGDIPPNEYFEVTLPLLTEDATPACSVNVLTYSFGNTSDDSMPPMNSPPMSSPPLMSETFGNTSTSPSISVIYTPPPVTCEWSHAVLEYQGYYKGEQYGSIAGVWIEGVELLRTSTAHPTEDGVLWSVGKDVTRYSSILTEQDLTLSVMLGSLGTDEFTGVYQVNVSFVFYSDEAIRLPSSVGSRESDAQKLNRKLISVNADKLELDRVIQYLYPYNTPADLIVPIAGAPDEGYWFKIEDESEVPTTNVEISPTTYKAVLELCVSFHGDDETWYMNTPDSYLRANNLTTGGHGTYREVFVTIDGQLVGTVIPLPVIYPSVINPLLWSPMVSHGALDLPCYDIDLTPFLGILLNNTNHSIGLQVVNSISYWLVNANLHLWSGETNVEATVKIGKPIMEIELEYDVDGTEGEFETEIGRSSDAISWIKSGTGGGAVRTKVKQEINYRNRVVMEEDGYRKELDMKLKIMTKIKITNEKGDTTAKIEIETIYPLTLAYETEPSYGAEDISRLTATILLERSVSYSDDKAKISRILSHNQNCTSSMLVNDNDSSITESWIENHQMYGYKDRLGCYSRNVGVVNGDVVTDDTLLVCPHETG